MAESETVTSSVHIAVQSMYLPERSAPEREFFFFAYQVKITNQGATPVKLLARHWIITDGTGRTEEVRGPGVVGEQPLLREGQSFSYTSACPLATPTGTMRGTYEMLTSSGDVFDAEVDPFALEYLAGVH
jgi:ApaG protein